MASQPVILLAEDREDDVLLVRKAFQSAEMNCRVQVVRDGEQAILYLSGEGQFRDRKEFPFPDLVLLDLKMPRVDGFEVLRWIRQQPGIRNLRVVVLTASNQIRDVNQAYRLGANSFLVKPLDFENFVETSKALRQYWLVLDNAPELSSTEKKPASLAPRPQDQLAPNPPSQEPAH